MLAVHQRMDANISDGAVIFLGDSITQSLAVESVTSPSVNYGIGQQTTQLLLDALPVYASLQRASAIVITIGINDILHGESKGLQERLRRIDRALPLNKLVLWNAIMPIREEIGGSHLITTIQSANTLLKNLCDARKQCAFVNTWQFLATRQGAADERYFYSDGIHLNDKGYNLWIRELRKTLKATQRPNNDSQSAQFHHE